MNKINTKKLSILASASVFALLSACSDGGSTGGSGDAIVTDANANANSTVDAITNGSKTIVPSEFSFPSIAAATDGAIAIPEGPMPTFPARRTLSAGAGNAIEFGDPVVVKYNMYSWTSGELVESTDSFDEPVTIRAGLAEGLPVYLSNSLLGRNVGEKMQVVFQPGMQDLPEYLDNTDAYVLVLDLL